MDYNLEKNRLIKFFLEHNHKTLMYEPGAGGEFLIYSISKYSPLFSKEFIHRQTSNNRFAIEYPLPLKGVPYVPESADFFDFLILHYYKESNIPLVDYLNNLEKNQPCNFLLRSHLNTNSFFNNKHTYIIHLNNRVFSKYSHFLRTLKTYIVPIELHTDPVRFKDFKQYTMDCTEEESSRIKEGLTYIVDFLKKQPDEFFKNKYHKHIELIRTRLKDLNYKEFSDLLETFNVSKQELLKYENFKNKSASLLENKSVIEYSQLFKQGYLEDMFKITGNEFHKELVAWHMRNLDLIKSHGLDTTDFDFL